GGVGGRDDEAGGQAVCLVTGQVAEPAAGEPGPVEAAGEDVGQNQGRVGVRPRGGGIADVDHRAGVHAVERVDARGGGVLEKAGAAADLRVDVAGRIDHAGVGRPGR